LIPRQQLALAYRISGHFDGLICGMTDEKVYVQQFDCYSHGWFAFNWKFSGIALVLLSASLELGIRLYT